MNKPKALLGCMRVADCTDGPALGSKVRSCSVCNRAVYVAPSGLKMVKERNLKIVCLDYCVPKKVRQMPPTPEQLQEILDDRRTEP